MPPMRSKSAKEVPPVDMSESLDLSKSDIGPLVLMSGYLTKKTRTRNRWIQRWWQLLDNGMLVYFLTDKREKLLGEIDIGRTCYDVHHGAKNCGIHFPRVAPRCCCFCFSVLKRTYYMYAPTAVEAKKWSESIHRASNVLNRRVVAGVKRRKAPEPPGPPRPPSCPPNFRISMTPWDQSSQGQSFHGDSLEDIHRIKVRDDLSGIVPTRRRRKQMASSVPDYLDRVGVSSPPESPTATSGSGFWLDGSPPPEPSHFSKPTNKMSSPVVAVAGGSLTSTTTFSRATSVPSSQIKGAGGVLHHQTSSVPSYRSPGHSRNHISPLWKDMKRHSLPISFVKEFDRLEKREEILKQRLASLGIPPRPASVATFPKSCYSHQPLPQPRPRHRHIPGAVQIIPMQINSALQTRQKTFSNSSEALYEQHEQESPVRSSSIGSSGKRPVPKPRKPKGAVVDETNEPKPQRNSKVTFADQTKIINATSPTGSDSSVSMTRGLVLVNPVSGEVITDTDDLPPPRPRKNTGPPTFVPPPPPIEENDSQ